MFRYTVSAITNIFERKVCEGGKKIEGRVRFGSRIRHGAHKGPHRNGSNRKMTCLRLAWVNGATLV